MLCRNRLALLGDTGVDTLWDEPLEILQELLLIGHQLRDNDQVREANIQIKRIKEKIQKIRPRY